MNEPTKVLGRRTAAVVIDYLLFAVVWLAIFFAMAEKRSDVEARLAPGEREAVYGNITIGDSEYSLVGGDFGVYLLIIGALGFLYWMLLPGLTGWTPGKLMLGLRVVKDDGSVPAGVGRNVVRQLLWVADDFPYFVPLVAPIVAATHERNKRVGDLAAGTLVVRADAAGQPIPGPRIPAAYAAPAAGQAPPAAAQPAPGWYPDPQGQAAQRYWDGTSWTGHTA